MEPQTYMLRDIPHQERPRERMLQYGASAVSNAELLAILLRTGTKQESAIHLAQRILQQVGSMRRLVDMSAEELMAIKGIGSAKAVQLKAGIELGLRLAHPHGRTRRHPQSAGCRGRAHGAAALFAKRTFCLSVFKYEKSHYCSRDAFNREFECLHRPSARGVSRRHQAQQRFDPVRAQPSERRSYRAPRTSR